MRGPATLLYGSSAIGGVVNIISRHHELDEHPHAGLRGILTALGGTANGFGGGSARIRIRRRLLLDLGERRHPAHGRLHDAYRQIQNSGTYMTQTGAGLARYGERAFGG